MLTLNTNQAVKPGRQRSKQSAATSPPCLPHRVCVSPQPLPSMARTRKSSLRRWRVRMASLPATSLNPLPSSARRRTGRRLPCSHTVAPLPPWFKMLCWKLVIKSIAHIFCDFCEIWHILSTMWLKYSCFDIPIYYPYYYCWYCRNAT
jgi:hypothetical protein